MSRTRSLIVTALMVAGIVAGALGAYVHARADATQERRDRSLATAKRALEEVDEHAGAARKDELLGEAQIAVQMADYHQDALVEQRQGALWFGAAALTALAAGTTVLLRGRRSGPRTPRGTAEAADPPARP
ncbi:hypothetical protein [Streptomyces radiopugnans]|uniref:Uncharacterized protein n=1 Tax=Streptomyces radiopugnans TaxID=403935 RepID=A0A1H8ZIX4_9ACTN|nr:hypothetical protein [Streptomyces radiopugnans]SEP63688.1 hypothetical protein SAMN05216481_101531 [Streptomyces radiopugnans]